MADLSAIRARLPDETITDATAQALYDDAEALALGYLNRDTLPDACENAVYRLAVVLYNRMGMEGEISRTEGSVSSSIDLMPADIRTQLRPWRLASTGGR